MREKPMNKYECNSTDTVSSPGSEARIISQPMPEQRSFDFKYLCKSIIHKPIRNIEACFLAPLKVYREKIEKTADRDAVLCQLGAWMDAFREKEGAGSLLYFWIYLAFDGGYEDFSNAGASADIGKRIRSCAAQNAKSLADSNSKLRNAEYIRRLCEARDHTECWILSLYELTLKKLYTSDDIAALIQKIIGYLRSIPYNIYMPAYISAGGQEERMVQEAANLMLLVMRLSLHIDSETALLWYKNGNASYFRYKDQPLADYLALVCQYPCQSYERLVKMEILANQGNKYAAKEAGDLYRFGAQLTDRYGNRVGIRSDQEKTSRYYGICLESGYIPAYIPAVQTGVWLRESQKTAAIQKAVADRNPEALSYNARACLAEADSLIQAEPDRLPSLLHSAANAISLLEDDYWEMYVLKSTLLLSDAFRFLRENAGTDGAEKNISLQKTLRDLYGFDALSAGRKELLNHMEEFYALAGRYGYFEAEYQLGRLFQMGDKPDLQKSAQYFETGKDKGCRKCMLEYAKLQQAQMPEMWLQTMLRLGRNLTENDPLQIILAKQWASCMDTNILRQIASSNPDTALDEMMEAYLQVTRLMRLISKSMSGNENTQELTDNIKLLNGLIEVQKDLKNLILEGGNGR